MKIEQLVLTPDLHSSPFENISNQTDYRIIQTNLTNQQFAEMGLLISDLNTKNSKFHQFLGLDSNLRSTHPILTQFSSYDGLLRKSVASGNDQPNWLAQFADRLNALDDAAIEDEITVSKKSRKEVNAFAASLHSTRMPAVFLVGNGNFRLRWSNKHGEKVGLQFRGDGDVQYLFFKRVGEKMEQMLGTKLVSTIESFIATCGLRHVIVE
jgi:hypothetical protein